MQNNVIHQDKIAITRTRSSRVVYFASGLRLDETNSPIGPRLDGTLEWLWVTTEWEAFRIGATERKMRERREPDSPCSHIMHRLDHHAVHDAFRDVEHRKDGGAHDEDRRISKMRTRTRSVIPHAQQCSPAYQRQMCLMRLTAAQIQSRFPSGPVQGDGLQLEGNDQG